MQTYLVTAPAVEPVTLDEARRHLRLDGADEDDLVLALVAAARGAVEGATRLRLIHQTWRLVLDGWPPSGALRVPLWPVAALAGVRARPGGEVPGDVLYLDRATDPARLVLHRPSLAPGLPAGGIEVDLVCGYGPAPADVPPPLRLAILRLVARWFSDRGDGEAGALPPDLGPLLAPFRRPRLVP